MTSHNGDERVRPAPPGKTGDNRAQAAPKRFYTDVSVCEAGDAFAPHLDGRGIRTPARSELCLPSRALAEAVAAEWRDQGDYIDIAGMFLTRLCNTAIDGVAPKLKEVSDSTAAFAASDLLYYRAEHPRDLVVRQARAWDGVLGWARQNYGVAFRTTSGVTFVDQPPETLAALGEAISATCPFEVSALHELTTLTGSCILALAVRDGHLTPDAAWEAAHVDEDYQIEKWGRDEEAERRRDRRWLEARAAARMLELLKA